MDSIREKAGIPVHFKHLLTEVNKNTKEATFKNNDTGDLVSVAYDFLHICPPQTALEFVANSPLADKNGF